MHAKPLSGVADLLRNLAADGRTELALLTGRPAHEVITLLDHPPVTVVGNHGYEWRPVGGPAHHRQPSPEQQQGLAFLANALQECNGGYRLEVKLTSLSVHTRGLDPMTAAAMEQEVMTQWGAMALQFGLEWRWFNGGIEVRCRGWNKGDALLTLLENQPADALIVYIGDDDTDEDAFAVLKNRGWGIKVGAASTRTCARAHLADCQAVATFLRTWLRVLPPADKEHL
jgi:trehalose-phosphatase